VIVDEGPVHLRSADSLRKFGTAIFERLNLPGPDAAVVPVLGVNPLAVGVPTGRRPAFVLDMAMSVIARGKMRLAGMHGEAIPEGLGRDAQGRPTTNGMQVFGGGSVLPADGFDEVLRSGEPKARRESERRRTGLPITAEVLASLQAKAAALRIP
jgi:LDH2 family malate/lactate/ureidoglycolate dehydrogenase